MTTTPDTLIQNAIAANLSALSQRLAQAADSAKQATDAMSQGQQNMAIGTILQLETILPEAQALFNAAIALHRGTR